MHVLNYLVAKLRDSAEDFRLVKHYLTRIDVLRQGKLGALNAMMYVNIRINDKEVNAMLDLSVHTFVTNKLEEKLGLQLNSSHTTMKTISFKTHKIIGMAYSMLIVLDQ